MENSIHKMRAAHLILSATLTVQGENAPTFSALCDTKGFVPTKVCKYLEIATAFEMTLASSASRLFHRICCRFAASMLEAGR